MLFDMAPTDCPFCHVAASPQQKMLKDWAKHLPAYADISDFINCSALFSNLEIYRCHNCGKFLKPEGESGQPSVIPMADLTHRLQATRSESLEQVLNFPPDLFRVITNELGRGNEVARVEQTEKQVTVLVLRGPFRDGHLVSSWIEFQELEGGPWSAWYFCEATQQAVACQHGKIQCS